MRSGDLKKRVKISRQVAGSPAVDEFGAPLMTWEELATVWAAVEPLNGREFWAQQQVQSSVSVRIRIRYLNSVLPGMKAEYNSKTYVIQNVIDKEEKHQELQLMCSEGVINA